MRNSHEHKTGWIAVVLNLLSARCRAFVLCSLGACLLALAGCQAAPYVPPRAESVAAKNLTTASRENATVLVVRTKATPFWFGADVVLVDGKVAGRVSNGYFIRFELRPGPHVITDMARPELPPISIDAKPGQIIFLRVVHGEHVTGAFAEFKRIDAAEAVPLLDQLTLDMTYATVI